MHSFRFIGSRLSQTSIRSSDRSPLGFASLAFVLSAGGVAVDTAFRIQSDKKDQENCKDEPVTPVRIHCKRSREQRSFLSCSLLNVERVLCEEDLSEDSPSGHIESERFYQCLEYHRSLLADYNRRWFGPSEEKVDTSCQWPRRVPTAREISSLELDLQFCRRSSNNTKRCQDKEFRIASYYVTLEDVENQKKGLKLVKDLAGHGHPDGMCLYGMLLNEGKIYGVEANPRSAAIWWRRCVDYHRHIKATYELGVAMYTGEGVVESADDAVRLFARAAHLGHAGAAYMLGECLLDGVGIPRDRANALEWLVTAAELGHHLARKRVIAVLNENHKELDAEQMEAERKEEAALAWSNLTDEAVARTVNIERRFSVGGGSRNPEVLARRMTKVQESRSDS